MTNQSYPIVILPLNDEDGGGFTAIAPDLVGCRGDGATEAEAVTDLRMAIVEWLDEARALGRRIPQPGEQAERMIAERRQIEQLIDELMIEVDAKLLGLSERVKNLETLRNRWVASSAENQLASAYSFEKH